MRNISRTRSSVLSKYKWIARIKDTWHSLHNALYEYSSLSLAYVTYLLVKEIGAAREGLLSDGNCSIEMRFKQSRPLVYLCLRML